MWTQRRVLTDLGGVWRHDPHSSLYYFLRYLSVPEFTWPGFINLARAGNASMEALKGSLFSYDAFDTHPVLDAPVYLLEGFHDQIQFTRLAQAYIDQVAAPHKELIWFEQSAHMPHWEDPDRFNQEVRRIAIAAGLI